MMTEHETDLLVVGAGPAGMACALAARLMGLDVLVCEKSEYVGGTGAYSAGVMWVPANTQGAEAGYVDSLEQAREYFDALIDDPLREPVREAFLAAGAEALDFFHTQSDVKLECAGEYPDYRSEAPGAAHGGRAVISAPFDGRLLGKDFNRVRPPIPEFTVLGGMMVSRADIAHLMQRYRSVKSFCYSAKLITRHLRDRLRYARGARLVMGNALVARLFYSLKARQVPVWFNAAATELIAQDNTVLGAVVTLGGKQVRVRARRGVVLATGGIAHDRKLASALFQQPAPYSLACPEATGDGLTLGLAVGGGMSAQGQGLGGVWAPVSRSRRKDGSEGLVPHFFDTLRPGLIAVARDGQRFVDESLSYHDMVAAMYARNGKVPTIPAHFICDSRFMQCYGLGKVPPGRRHAAHAVREGYLVCADSLEALTQKIGVDSDGLRTTISRHNRFAQTGVDEDFGKGSTHSGRIGGDPNIQPNPCLAAITQAPFYALEVWPAPTASGIGLETNGDGQVLNAEGAVVPGLYTCGNDMSSIMGGVPTGPGLTLGPALVFAYRVARKASAVTF